MNDTKPQKTSGYYVAKLISRLFDVPVAGLIILYVVWQNSPESSSVSARSFFFFSMYAMFITILMIILLIRLKILDSWELKDRGTRKYVYGIGFIILSITSFFAFFTELDNYFMHLIGLAYSIVIVYGLITNFTQFKPSLHMGFWTLTFLLFAHFYGLIYLWLSPILILIGWARLRIKNHTVYELLLGFSLMVFLVGIYIFLFR